MTRTLLISILAIQVATFVVYGAWMLRAGHYRIGIGQLLLAAVQGIVYSSGLPR